MRIQVVSNVYAFSTLTRNPPCASRTHHSRMKRGLYSCTRARTRVTSVPHRSLLDETSGHEPATRVWLSWEWAARLGGEELNRLKALISDRSCQLQKEVGRALMLIWGSLAHALREKRTFSGKNHSAADLFELDWCSFYFSPTRNSNRWDIFFSSSVQYKEKGPKWISLVVVSLLARPLYVVFYGAEKKYTTLNFLNLISIFNKLK